MRTIERTIVSCQRTTYYYILEDVGHLKIKTGERSIILCLVRNYILKSCIYYALNLIQFLTYKYTMVRIFIIRLIYAWSTTRLVDKILRIFIPLLFYYPIFSLSLFLFFFFIGRWDSNEHVLVLVIFPLSYNRILWHIANN